MARPTLPLRHRVLDGLSSNYLARAAAVAMILVGTRSVLWVLFASTLTLDARQPPSSPWVLRHVAVPRQLCLDLRCAAAAAAAWQQQQQQLGSLAAVSLRVEAAQPVTWRRGACLAGVPMRRAMRVWVHTSMTSLQWDRKKMSCVHGRPCDVLPTSLSVASVSRAGGNDAHRESRCSHDKGNETGTFKGLRS